MRMHPVSYTHLDVYKRQAQWSESLYTVEIGNEADVNHAFRLSSARQPKWAGEAIRFGVERLRAWADALRSRRTAIVLSLIHTYTLTNEVDYIPPKKRTY